LSPRDISGFLYYVETSVIGYNISSGEGEIFDVETGMEAFFSIVIGTWVLWGA